MEILHAINKDVTVYLAWDWQASCTPCANNTGDLPRLSLLAIRPSARTWG